MSALVHVPFHGDELLATQDDDGIWVSVRRVCEALGLDRKSQQRRLQAAVWATGVMMTLVAEDGKQRRQFMLHLDALPMWLATIETSRVAPEVRPKLERYQLKAARVLAEHFLREDQLTAHEAFIASLLLAEPKQRDTFFRESVWRAVESLYRPEAKAAVRPSAAFKGYVGHIYRRFFGDRAKAELRQRNQHPSQVRDYAFLSDKAYEELKEEQWIRVEMIATLSYRRFGCSQRARDAFWSELDALTGFVPEPEEQDPRQLPLFGDLALAGGV